MKADCKGAICQLDNTLIVAVALSACRKITMELSELRISITAFSAVSGTKAAETVTGKHCTLPREWMPSS